MGRKGRKGKKSYNDVGVKSADVFEGLDDLVEHKRKVCEEQKQRNRDAYDEFEKLDGPCVSSGKRVIQNPPMDFKGLNPEDRSLAVQQTKKLVERGAIRVSELDKERLVHEEKRVRNTFRARGEARKVKKEKLHRERKQDKRARKENRRKGKDGVNWSEDYETARQVAIVRAKNQFRKDAKAFRDELRAIRRAGERADPAYVDSGRHYLDFLRKERETKNKKKLANDRGRLSFSELDLVEEEKDIPKVWFPSIAETSENRKRRKALKLARREARRLRDQVSQLKHAVDIKLDVEHEAAEAPSFIVPGAIQVSGMLMSQAIPGVSSSEMAVARSFAIMVSVWFDDSASRYDKYLAFTGFFNAADACFGVLESFTSVAQSAFDSLFTEESSKSGEANLTSDTWTEASGELFDGLLEVPDSIKRQQERKRKMRHLQRDLLNEDFDPVAYDNEKVEFDHKDDGYVYEAWSDQIASLKGWVVCLVSKAKASVLRKIVVQLVCKKIIPENWDIVSKHFKEVPEEVDAFSFMELVLDGLVIVTRFFEGLALGLPLIDILFQDDPGKSFVSKTKSLLKYEDYLYVGAPVEGFMEAGEFVREVDELIAFGSAHVKRLPVTDRFVGIIRVHLDDLRKARIKGIGVMQTSRPIPFGIYVHGKPGVGKDKLVEYFVRCCAELVDGVDFNKAMLYSRKPGMNFWDGYNSTANPYIQYSELGAETRTKAAHSTLNPLIEVLNLMGTSTELLNMASLDDKGMQRACPRIVACDSNTKDANVHLYMQHPEAWMRRWWFIEVQVQEEFCIPGTTQICPQRSKAKGGNLLDRYIFCVEKHYAGQAHPMKWNTTSLDEIVSFITSQYARHSRYEAYTSNLAMEAPIPLCRGAGSANENIVTFDDGAVFLAGNYHDLYAYITSGRHIVGGPVTEEEILRWADDSLDLDGVELRNERDVAEADESSSGVSEAGVLHPDDEEKKSAYPFVLASIPEEGKIEVDAEGLGRYGITPEEYEQAVIFSVEKEERRYANLPWRERWKWQICHIWDILMQVLTLSWFEVSAYATEKIISRPLSWFVYLIVSNFVSWWISVLWVILAGGMVTGSWWHSDLGSTKLSILRRAILPRYAVYGKALVGVIGVTIAITYCVKLMRRLRVTAEAAEKGSNVSDPDVRLHDLVAEHDQEEPYVKLEKKDTTWTKMHNVVEPAAFTQDMDEFSKFVARNVFTIRADSGDDSLVGHAIGIGGEFFITNAHYFSGKESHTIFMPCPGSTKFQALVVSEERVYRFEGLDLVMFSVPGYTCRDITKHFAEDFPRVAESVLKGRRVVASFRKSNVWCSGVEIPNAYGYTMRENRKGFCGSPLLGNVVRGCQIIGIHSAGRDEVGIALTIPRSKLLQARKILRERIGLFHCYPEGASLGRYSFESPVSKSLVRYEPLDKLKYLGKLPGPVCANGKSNLKKTPLAASGLLPKVFSEVGFTMTEKVGKPMMCARIIDGEWISPYNVNMRKMGECSPALDVVLMQRTVDYLEEYHTAHLRVQEGRSFHVLTYHEAVNGVDWNAYIDRVNASTSAGYGFAGKKAQWLPLEDDGVTRTISPEVMEEVQRIESAYMAGEMYHPIIDGKLKDEARDIAKCFNGKTRVFYQCNVAHLIVSRRIIGPILSLVVEQGAVFSAALGINAHRDGWEIWNVLEQHPNIIEWDYSGFDRSMPVDVGRMSATLIVRLARRLGYDETEMKLLEGLLSDSLYPTVEILLDTFVAAGLQPSGKYGTAEENTLRNLCILVYFWFWSGLGDSHDFFECVALRAYGDDITGSVVDDIKKVFNNLTFRDFCRSVLHMDTTPSAKNGEMTEFVKREDATFLKRRCVWSTVLDRPVLPLAIASVYKSLEWFIPSSQVPAFEQNLLALTSGCYEMFFNFVDEPDKYNRWLIAVQKAMSQALELDIEIVTKYTPTYERLLAKYRDDIEIEEEDEMYVVDPECFVRSANVCFDVCGIGGVSRKLVHQDCKKVLRSFSQGDVLLSRDELYSLIENHLDELDLTLDEALILSDVTHGGARNLLTARKLASVQCVAKLYDLYIQGSDYEYEAYEGEMKDGGVGPASVTMHENVTDVGGAEPHHDEPSAPYQMMNQGERTVLDLDAFFERPVEIDRFSVVPGSEVNRNLSIWDLYSRDPTVRAKLRNYTYFRGNLKVRIAISGTPFHYGRLMFSYQPYPLRNDTLQNLLAGYALFPGLKQCLCNYYSQSPNCVVVDVKANKPVEMMVPFLSVKPFHRLFNTGTGAITAVTPFDDMAAAGSLYIISLNAGGSVSASPSPYYVQIYVSAENVELGVPTATRLEVDTEGDERIVGPVEKVASSAQEVARALSMVPTIAPFAMAATSMFDGMRRFAAIFGWAKPGLQEELTYVKNRAFQNGSVCISHEAVEKLTFDPKQELTVDPRVVGEEVDEMSISYLTSINTFLTTFQWQAGSSALQFWIKPNPKMTTWFDTGSQEIHVPTAMSFAATPFSFWRGDTVITVEVVCSAFHRGKMAVVFEPNIEQALLLTSTLQLNKQFVTVIDIQETQHVSFVVEWAGVRPWLKILDNSTATTSYGVGIVSAFGQNFCNGMVMFFPFTELQSPDDSSVDVNVYVRGKDVQFNVPRDTQLLQTALPIVASLAEQKEFDLGGVIASPDPIQVDFEGARYDLSDTRFPLYVDYEGRDYSFGDMEITDMVLNPTGATNAHISEWYFGEQPVSFRSMCKRFHAIFGETLSGVGILRRILRVPWLAPPTNGYGGYPAPSNRYLPHLMGYLRYAYVGVRGGVRYRVVVNDSSLVVTSKTFDVNLEAPTTGIAYFSYTSGTSITFPNTIPRALYNGGTNGNLDTNYGIEFEVPFYSNNLFLYGFRYDGETPSDNSVDTFYTRGAVCTVYGENTAASSTVSVGVQMAAAEDWTLLRYQGAPYYQV